MGLGATDVANASHFVPVLDELVTRRLKLPNINEAFRTTEAGAFARSVIMS